MSQTHSALLSPPSVHHGRRRSSVMFSDVILLHGSSVNTLPGSVGANGAAPTGERNVCSSEKMTQTGDGNVWAPTPHANNVQVCFFSSSFFLFIISLLSIIRNPLILSLNLSRFIFNTALVFFVFTVAPNYFFH